MNKLHKRKMILIFVFSLLSISIAFLVLNALKYNINLYVTPTQLLKDPSLKVVRLGGKVVDHSLSFKEPSHDVNFEVTDGKNKIPVFFHGLLPALFQEGKGMIAEGIMNNEHTFVANYILAKHDENYQPPVIKK